MEKREYKFSDIHSYFPDVDNDEEVLSQHHRFEKYDPLKDYKKKEYKEDYGHGERKYRNVLYEFGNKEKHVVAEEQVSKEELLELEKYCECDRCKFDKRLKKMNFLFWLILYILSWIPGFLYVFVGCRCCIGCLKTDFPRKYYIEKAREKLV